MTFSDLRERLNDLDVVKNAPSKSYVYHLSHNDLDGYSAQLVAKRFLGQTKRFNSGYGLEVSAKLSLIGSLIEKTPNRDENLILISDLNITREDCKLINEIVSSLKKSGHKIELKLLDHHKSGAALAEEFEWYFLDESKCATKIVYDWCSERVGDCEAARDKALVEYVACVNAYDLWLQDERDRFEFGKALNRLVMDAREISSALFSFEENDYRLSLLEAAFEYLEGYRNIDLDDQIIAIKKRYLRGGGERDTIDNLSARFVTKLLIQNRDRMKVNYEGHKGILTFQIGNISVLGNAFLSQCPDYDFILDIGRNGNISLRADGKIDVSV
ncbi:MAG: phosphoesterase, partial [Helicobacteraceae bacterium]|nr:phosphoesterase [Helicobacteraceae bacterium]